MFWTSAYGVGSCIGRGNIVINDGVDPTEPWIFKVSNALYSQSTSS